MAASNPSQTTPIKKPSPRSLPPTDDINNMHSTYINPPAWFLNGWSAHTANLSRSSLETFLSASTCVLSIKTLGTILSPSGWSLLARSASFQRVAQRHQVQVLVGDAGDSGPVTGQRELRSLPRDAENLRNAGVMIAATARVVSARQVGDGLRTGGSYPCGTRDPQRTRRKGCSSSILSVGPGLRAQAGGESQELGRTFVSCDRGGSRTGEGSPLMRGAMPDMGDGRLAMVAYRRRSMGEEDKGRGHSRERNRRRV